RCERLRRRFGGRGRAARLLILIHASPRCPGAPRIRPTRRSATVRSRWSPGMVSTALKEAQAKPSMVPRRTEGERAQGKGQRDAKVTGKRVREKERRPLRLRLGASTT